MVQGFLFESEGPKRMISTWVEGAPEKSWFGSAKVPKEKCVPVGTFRCSVRGFGPMRGQSSARNNAASPVLRSFLDSRFGKCRGLVRPRLRGAQPNQPLHLTAAALRFSVFNVSPAGRGR